MPETIRLRNPDGAVQDVDVRTAATVLQDPRWSVATAEDETARVAEQAREVNYGGVGGAVKAGAAAVARGATLGASDVAARALFGEDAAIELEGLRQQNEGISIGGEVLGALAPALVTGGAALPAGAAARAGAGVARATEGALGRIGGAAAGGAAEGALFGVGQGVSELALSQDPLTVERVASTLSSNALFGAGLGAGAGALVKGAELGLSRAKGAIDGALERRVAKARTADEAIESGDLETLDVRQLKAARDGELEALRKAGQPQREGFVADLEAARKEALEKKIWNSVAGRADRESSTLARGYLDADKRLDRLLKERVTLAEHPERALGPLRAQQQALEALDSLRVRESAAWETELATAPARIRADLAEISAQPSLAARQAMAKQKGIKGELGPFTEEGLDNATERVIRARYGDLTNPERPRRLQLLDKVPEELSVNRDLQRVLEGVTAAPTSDRLTKIEAALEVLAQPKAPEVGLGAAISAVAPFAGPLGAAAAAGNRVLGSFQKVAAAATTRVAKAASSFLDVATKGAAKAGPIAPVLATKTLAAVRYAEPGSDRERPAAAQPKAQGSLPDLYRARTDEIKGQIHVAADGSYQMRPDARAKMATRFDGIRAADPLLADKLEELVARRLEYLAGIIPRLPDYGTIQIGPERRQVSELEMRSFARSVAATEDPYGVLERATHGTVTPEDAAAIKAVYPELLAEFTTQVVEQLPSLRRNLPYKRRLALSILTGVPVDPAMTPGVLRQLQSMYTTEPGTEGGTQAPRAEAQFGSVSRQSLTNSATPAQRRQQGAA